MGMIINHYIRIPMKQPVFQWRVRPFRPFLFFRKKKKTCSLGFLKIWPVQKALELAILFKSMGFLLGGSGPRYRKWDHPHL